MGSNDSCLTELEKMTEGFTRSAKKNSRNTALKPSENGKNTTQRMSTAV